VPVSSPDPGSAAHDACLTLTEGLVKNNDLSQAHVLLSDVIQRDPAVSEGINCSDGPISPR